MSGELKRAQTLEEFYPFSSSLSLSSKEICLGGRYHFGIKIGSGSFGDVYIGVNITTGEEVAIQ